MGIPRLISHLEPYAVSTVLGCKTAKCNEHQRLERAIIDGPSLVYHVYHRILAHKSPSKNHIDAVPSYEELGKAILVFLDELENHGLAMYASTDFYG